MKTGNSKAAKEHFLKQLKDFTSRVAPLISTDDGWIIRGYIDHKRIIHPVSSDTKLLSKMLELQLFPYLEEFANDNGFVLELPDEQNWYPDATFINKKNETEKYAVDLKTTYRDAQDRRFCNGFTLGSHGEYFKNRNSKKNIQYPYSEYKGHFVVGILYDRCATGTSIETATYTIDQLESIPYIVKNFEVFAEEKWKIASDIPGSGNTANIGSIKYIKDILSGNGIFAVAGEEFFDDYWKAYKKGGTTTFKKYLEAMNEDPSLCNRKVDKRNINKLARLNKL